MEEQGRGWGDNAVKGLLHKCEHMSLRPRTVWEKLCTGILDISAWRQVGLADGRTLPAWEMETVGVGGWRVGEGLT